MAGMMQVLADIAGAFLGAGACLMVIRLLCGPGAWKA
jgi:hypothetical protein